MVWQLRDLSGPIPGLERILGWVRGRGRGPTLIAVGGLHGNEPAGILALQNVLRNLEGRATSISGEFVALTGNRAALAEDRRYLGRDLNRAWLSEANEAWAPPMPRREESGNGGSLTDGSDPEDGEQRELLRVLEEVISSASGPVFLLDLHTTSGPGEPFSTIMDSLSNRRFALGIPVPLIVGLGELVEGTLMSYLADRGVAAMVFEGGGHRDPASITTTEAAIWVALARSGVVSEATFPEVAQGRKRLISATEGLPSVLEMRYRHPIDPQDGFRMLPGFRSFQPVKEGQILAHDRAGEVRSPETGRLLMPLYQDQGEDGFFIVREFHPFWLTVSEVLRRLRVDRFVHWMPGVRKDREHPERLVVDRRLARWYTNEVLHLLGFRKKLESGDRLVVLRQVERDGS